MKQIKNIENMNLEELLELENKTFILSKSDIVKSLSIFPFISFYNLFTSFYNNYNLNDTFCFVNNPNIINTLAITVNLTIGNFFKGKYDEYRANSPIRKELTRLYDDLLIDLLDEIEESSIDSDPLNISILVGNYLLPNGLLSYTPRFHVINSNDCYDIQSEYNEMRTLEGLYVISGYGCCRHVNSFVVDLLVKKGIKSDKVPCIDGSYDSLMKRIDECNFIPNHLIVGYIENNKYYFIDPYNNNYSFFEQNNYYETEIADSNVIPLFTLNAYQYSTNWNNNICDCAVDIPKLIQIRKNVYRSLIEGDYLRFKKFKEEHFEIYEKIAYLTSLELDRNKEKEIQKLKRI